MVQLHGQAQQVRQGGQVGQRAGGVAWQPLRRHATRVVGRPAAPRHLEAHIRLSFSEGGEPFALELVETGLRWARVRSALLLDVGQTVWVRGDGLATPAQVTDADTAQGFMTLAWAPVEG